jgi:hypothetical protein
VTSGSFTVTEGRDGLFAAVLDVALGWEDLARLVDLADVTGVRPEALAGELRPAGLAVALRRAGDAVFV